MQKAFLLAVGAFTLAACASSQKPPEVTQTGQAPESAGSAQTRNHACPMAVEGTVVEAADIEGGSALVFTTTGDVGELRQRVTQMAEIHNACQARRGMMMGPSEPTGESRGRASDRPAHAAPGRMMMRMVPASARVEEVPGGARMVFIPEDPGDLDALRQHVAQMAEHMKSGRCPMMTSPPSKEQY